MLFRFVFCFIFKCCTSYGKEEIEDLNHLSLQLYSIWFQFHPFLNCICHINLNNTASRTFIIQFLPAIANVVAKSLLLGFSRKISKMMNLCFEMQFCINWLRWENDFYWCSLLCKILLSTFLFSTNSIDAVLCFSHVLKREWFSWFTVNSMSCYKWKIARL